MNILVTGCCGFIGFHLTKNLCGNKKNKIFGIDNLNNYYDVRLKKARLNILQKSNNFQFYKIDISNKKKLETVFQKKRFKCIIHLAAQAGVRNSIIDPDKYFKSNILGFYNVLNLSRDLNIGHFIFSSTSSVYGNNKIVPFSENTNSDFPLSFYAATKKSNEVIAHSYSNIYKLPTTILRLFTVFGTYGRPDMAIHKFTKNIKNNNIINLYNDGKHYRDFTHIDKVTTVIEKLISKPPAGKIPFAIYNVASGRKTRITTIKKMIEKSLNKKSKVKYSGFKKGDVFQTHANVKKIKNKLNLKSDINLQKNIKQFVDWYEKFY
ncbi:GDP-mannose 4,6-dehydratase [Pelagibacteraceae bacterium]|nr:GDP-mannose 4,6-dehydratase [Pelagibacteraceae bacterium]